MTAPADRCEPTTDLTLKALRALCARLESGTMTVGDVTTMRVELPGLIARLDAAEAARDEAESDCAAALRRESAARAALDDVRGIVGRLVALRAKGSPAPWWVDEEQHTANIMATFGDPPTAGPGYVTDFASEDAEAWADAELIVAAVNSIAALDAATRKGDDR